MSYDCNFLEVNPFKTPIRTQSEIDRKIWDWQYNPDVEIPTMIILHHPGMFYKKDGYTEEGVTWHLKESGPENNLSDIKLETHYFPVLGVSRYIARVDIKEKDIDHLKPWVVNQPYFHKYYENFQKVFVPAICFHIGMYWVWETKRPADGRKPYKNTAHIVIPTIWDLERHDRNDDIFGDSYLSYNDRKYMIGDLTELEFAYNDLVTEFNIMYTMAGLD